MSYSYSYMIASPRVYMLTANNVYAVNEIGLTKFIKLADSQCLMQAVPASRGVS